MGPTFPVFILVIMFALSVCAVDLNAACSGGDVCIDVMSTCDKDFRKCRCAPRYFAFNNKCVLRESIWDTTPGTITVFENTKALFNWTFTINSYVDLSWDYHGTDGKQDQYILGYSVGQLDNRPGTGKESRLAYIEGPGSAAITLDSIISEDSGYYEASVFPPKEVIRNSAKLVVIKASDLHYNVTIGNHTFTLSVENNGSDVMLPEQNLLLPTRLPVTISINRLIPAPQIETRAVINNVSYPELPCGVTHKCERTIPFFVSHAEHQRAIVVSELLFDIDNLGVIQFTLPVTLRTKTIPTVGTTPITKKLAAQMIPTGHVPKQGLSAGVIAGIGIAVIILLLVLTVSLVLAWTRRKRKTISVFSMIIQRSVLRLPTPNEHDERNGSAEPLKTEDIYAKEYVPYALRL